MRIVTILFRMHFFRLSYSIAAAGIIVLFFCCPLWGSIPDLHRQRPHDGFSIDYKGPLADAQMIRINGFLAKRGSSNQHFQQWQNLSPKEQEKMRKKYREWQSLPPQKRKLYKQLFRQWQHLSPRERKQLLRDLNNWENLSPKQRKSIRRRFKN